MARDYWPSTDAGKLTFVNNMVALITASGAPAWGLVAATLTTLTGYVTDFGTKLAAATEPATRSRANTYAKNQSRSVMVQYIRDVIVPTIQGSQAVTDEMKYDMALTVRGANGPTPIPAPTEVPVPKVISVNGWTTDVQITTAGSTRRGLPDGCAGINIYSFVGPSAPTDPLLWDYEGESSKARFKIEAPAATVPAGSKVWYTFCFKSPRFQTGPACAGVAVIVGGGVPETTVG